MFLCGCINFCNQRETLLVTEKKFSLFPIAYWKTATPAFKTVCLRLWLFALVNSADVFLLLYLKLHGFTDTQMIAAYLLYNVVFAATAYPIGILADKTSYKPVLFTGLMLFAIVYIGITLTTNLLLLYALMIVYGLYASCFDATAKAFLAIHCKKEEAGSAFGLFGAINSLATLLASVWAGIVWQQGFPATAMVITAMVAFFIAVSFWFRDVKSNQV